MMILFNPVMVMVMVIVNSGCDEQSYYIFRRFPNNKSKYG